MKINDILKEQIELIKPSLETQDKINKTTKEFMSYLDKNLKKNKMKADVFLGGSVAKSTLIKKEIYDVDIFIRFENSKDMGKLHKILKKAKKVHGSRDYYQLEVSGVVMEIIPVLKIKKPEQAENVTDLSYFHVKYVLDKIKKNKRLADEIRLAKTFCHANNCYGAESYIHGFSGYALELLICHYKSFLSFIKAIAKINIDKKEKLVIDDSKFYLGKNIIYELNEAKTQSPIILVDPTFKERNALAGLNHETFFHFQKTCKEFLRKPSKGYFINKDIHEELTKKYQNKLKIVSVKTSKQAGDISGSKSLKFFYFFVDRLNREFIVKVSEFNYNDEKNTAYFYLVLDKKRDEIRKGPKVVDVNNLTRFKKIHKNAFIKNNVAYAKINHNLSFEKWLKEFNKKEKEIIKQMSVKKIDLNNI
ncbi:MAG: nucleotidyltransferase domain-containing protein [Candidatus Pacearchaeota archaeon]